MTSQSIFADGGSSVHAVTMLGWVLTATACLVVVVVGVLILVALFRRRAEHQGVSEEGEREGRRWILLGTALSVLILLGTFVYTLAVLTHYASGLDSTRLTIRIVGYRYWWEADYLDAKGAVDFVTANEIHIPVGVPVRLELQGGDVIHSFWVPALAGKTDLVPGQTNVMWVEADAAGRYSGQCAEFCGTSHANMRIELFADRPEVFPIWVTAQRRRASPGGAAMSLFQARGCAACHAIAGTSAGGKAGPDLTHIGSRTTLAAGVLPNTSDDLARWLAAPDSVKPGTLMPNVDLTAGELSVMVAYLENLR